jgi:hypothetical protein
MVVIDLILAIAKAIPVIDKWLDALTVARIESMKKTQREALRKALDEHDQRDLEKAIGSPGAGEPSGNPDSVISDTPPPGV